MLPEDRVTAAKNGDMTAFDELFAEYHNNLYYFALNHIKNPSDAEDIVQETFIEAFNGIRTLKEPQAFKSWLYTIAHRQCVKAFRHGERMVPVADGDFEEATQFVGSDDEFLPEYVMESEETRQAVAELVGALPETQKTAILMYYFEELGVKDIARIENCSEGTVKSRLNYARKFIKDKVEASRKKGAPILTVTPVPLLTRILREMAAHNQMSEEAANRVMQNVSQSVATAGTAAAVTGGAVKTGMSAMTKAAISIAAGIVVTTGVVVGVILSDTPPEAPVPPENNEIVETTAAPAVTETPAPIQEPAAPEPVPEPVTVSDFARLYYEFIQSDLKVNGLLDGGVFSDADLLSFPNDDIPKLIVSGEDGEMIIYTYTSHGILDIFYWPKMDATPPSDSGQNYSSYSYTLYIAELEGRPFIVMHTYAKFSDNNFHSIERENLNWTELQLDMSNSEYHHVSWELMQLKPDDDAVLSVYHDNEAVTMDEFSAWEERLKPYSTWAIAIYGEPLKPNENTNGERLKNYFDD